MSPNLEKAESLAKLLKQYKKTLKPMILMVCKECFCEIVRLLVLKKIPHIYMNKVLMYIGRGEAAVRASLTSLRKCRIRNLIQTLG